MSPTAEKIVARSDKGHTPADIVDALGVSLTLVYKTLREHRPKRERAPRPCTSIVRKQIFALHRKGEGPATIAGVLDVSRQYVYKILAEAE